MTTTRENVFFAVRCCHGMYVGSTDDDSDSIWTARPEAARRYGDVRALLSDPRLSEFLCIPFMHKPNHHPVEIVRVVERYPDPEPVYEVTVMVG